MTFIIIHTNPFNLLHFCKSNSYLTLWTLFQVAIWGVVGIAASSCGQSYEEQQRTARAERTRLSKEDSLALKVGTLPTLDCLPLFIAKERHLFDTLGVDVRLRPFRCQIDCDAALQKEKIEGCITDVVRAERMSKQGFSLYYLTSTEGYWQLISNRKARINQIKQLPDKIIAMTRYSVTDLLVDIAIDSAKLNTDNVYRVQINDPQIRLQMLQNNEMDAMFLPEPYATTARLYKNSVLMDSREKDIKMGVIVFREKAIKDKRRTEQLSRFKMAYNKACDSLNAKGVKAYADILKKYTSCDDKTLQALPQMNFPYAAPPRILDREIARKWLRKSNR